MHRSTVLHAAAILGCALMPSAVHADIWLAQSPCVVGAAPCGAVAANGAAAPTPADEADLRLVVQGGEDPLRSDMRRELAQALRPHVTAAAAADAQARWVLDVMVQRADGAADHYVAATLTDSRQGVMAALPWIRVDGGGASTIVAAILYGLDVDPATLAPLHSQDRPTRNLQALGTYQEARHEYQAGHFERAIRLLLDAIHQDPMFAMAYWSIGVIVEQHPSLKPDDRTVEDWEREAAMIDAGHPRWRLDSP